MAVLARSRARLAARLVILAGLAAAAIAIVAAPSVARADDPEAARAAYDRGAAAFQAKRYAEAANELARADALAPNAVALASALKAAELADDAVLAMTLADRAELRPGVGDAALANARRVREKLGGRVGKLSVRCAAVRGCVVTLDADPFPAEQQRWVKTGAHAIEITAGSSARRYTVTVEGGKTLEFQEPGAAATPPPAEPPKAEPPKVGPPFAAPPFAAPPRTEPPKLPPPRPEAAGGISPAWFFVSLGVTAAVGGASIASGVDTLGKHADFEQFLSTNTAGVAAQARTNVLLGVTTAAALATAGIGIFAVRWSSRPAPAQGAPQAAQARWIHDVTAAPTPSGLVVRARF